MSSSNPVRVQKTVVSRYGESNTESLLLLQGAGGSKRPLATVVAPASPIVDPVVIGGCSGWMHTREREESSETAVLICPGLVWDGLLAYQPLRLLADQFAAAGYPTLRFNYPGAGDSRELAEDETDSLGAWLDSVQQAADWLRAATGASRVVLAGLRLGASIAMLAAERRSDVAGLLLLAPVLRGRSYLKQIEIEARTRGLAATQDGGVDFHDLRLTAANAARINAIDLRQARVGAGVKVAMFGTSSPRLDAECVQEWTGRGAVVATAEFGGLAPMLQENTNSTPPALDASPVLAWLRASFVARRSQQRPGPYGQACLHMPGLTETPLRFGPAGKLFGVLCQPIVAGASPAVVIVNSGRDPHQGVGRSAVHLARCLAASGIASIRFDFTGLGDSPGLAGATDVLSPLFEVDRSADIGAAIDALQAHGYREFAVQGLCSGAYHAFRAALQDKRIGTLLLVNFPVFEWRAGDTVNAVKRRLASPGHYLAKIAGRRFWRRLAAGEIAIAHIAGSQLRRASNRLAQLASRLAGRRNDPERAMAALSSRGVRTLFLFADKDPGLNEIDRAFGSGGARLRRRPGAAMQVTPLLDHALSTSLMRQEAADRMMAFIGALAPGKRSASGCAAAQTRPAQLEGATHDDPRDDPRPGHDDCRPAWQETLAAD